MEEVLRGRGEGFCYLFALVLEVVKFCSKVKNFSWVSYVSEFFLYSMDTVGNWFGRLWEGVFRDLGEGRCFDESIFLIDVVYSRA